MDLEDMTWYKRSTRKTRLTHNKSVSQRYRINRMYVYIWRSRERERDTLRT